MKQFLKNRKLILFLFLCICLVVLSAVVYETDETKFRNICNSIFRHELSQDGISLHFMLANPASYGLSGETDRFYSYNKEDRLKQNLFLENALEQLREVDKTKLTSDNQLSYDFIMNALSNSLEGEEFIYFMAPFSPTQGVQSEYPLLMAEYAFRNETDVKNYLNLLAQTPDYFDALIAFEKERLENGYGMADESADQVIATCDEFATNGDLFIKTFENKLAKLTASNLLTAAQAETYQEQNKQIVSNIVQTAYNKLKDDILVLKGNYKEEMGLYHKHSGKDYYAYLLKTSIGTSKSPDELMELLRAQFTSECGKLSDCIASLSPDALTNYYDPLTTLSPDEILKDLQKRMQKDFPLMASTDYPYHVYDVDKVLEKYTAPAYYFTPPIDALNENNIYINRSSVAEGVDLYTTLAHEGFPGHLYQSVSTQIHFNTTQTPLLRSLLGCGGFVEGYATYAEMYSYSYAKECANELAPNQNFDTIYEILRLDRSAKLCLYSMIDLMIHHEGKSLEDVAAFLETVGIKDTSAAESIYDYIVNEPTNYLKYYVGYLEILECQKLAKESWKESYSDAAFHSFLMEIGPAPFDVIRKEITEYL